MTARARQPRAGQGLANTWALARGWGGHVAHWAYDASGFAACGAVVRELRPVEVRFSAARHVLKRAVEAVLGCRVDLCPGCTEIWWSISHAPRVGGGGADE